MNYLFAYLVGQTLGNIIRAFRPPSMLPPYPPNYVFETTGVPPPPFARHSACPLYHYPNTRCRMCERLVVEGRG